MHAPNQPTIHQIRSNHTPANTQREIEREAHRHKLTHTARRSLALSIHSERHRNFVLLVTRKIWLRQCHRNNLSSFFSFLFSFGSFYCLVWVLSLHLIVWDHSWCCDFETKNFGSARMEWNRIGSSPHCCRCVQNSVFNLFLCSHSAVCQSRIGFVSI